MSTGGPANTSRSSVDNLMCSPATFQFGASCKATAPPLGAGTYYDCLHEQRSAYDESSGQEAHQIFSLSGLALLNSPDTRR